MKNFLIAIVCVITLAACSPKQSDLVSENLNSMVVIFNSPPTLTESPSGTQIQPPSNGGGGMGTGFIIGENLIVTNNHVVQGKGGIIKVMGHNDMKLYDAEIIAADKPSDLAVIRLKDWDDFKKHMNPRILPWGSSRELKVGDTVWSMGNPYGLFFTVAQGIISHKLRPVDNQGNFYLQTTTQIYPGNSGGPLLNNNGEVIAVNSAIVGKEGYFGMAIPSDLAKKLVKDLIEHKQVKRCRVGMSLGPSDDFHNVKVNAINNDSPAIDAGLLPNDIIVAVSTAQTNGWMEIEISEQLIYEVQLLSCDQKVKLEVIRDGDSRVIETKLMDVAISP